MKDCETAYRIDGSKKIKLDDLDTKDKSHVLPKKDQRKRFVTTLSKKLNEYQDILYADANKKVLIILQGMDTSGKDGTIRKVFQNVDPLGVRAQAFKAPTTTELARDFLWRVHLLVPKAGELVIFNRSHYEDVLTTVVNGMIDEAEYEKRIRHINQFEELLTDTGTIVIKLFLHISKDEQRKRIQSRIDEPEKNWKFATSDIEDRKKWDAFHDQYERVINATSTKYAPWYIIPADNKSVRDQVALEILIKRFAELRLMYPEVDASNFPKVVD